MEISLCFTIEYIRSNLSVFSARVSGVAVRNWSADF